MRADVAAAVNEAGYRPDPDGRITVQLGPGNRQVLHLDPDASAWALRVWTPIAPGRLVEAASEDGEVLRYAWERNRLSELIGFTIDRYGRLIGETWIPLEGLSPAEIQLHLQELARVCDWHDVRLSGDDTY